MMTKMRLAIIQHGDYASAFETYHSDQLETYAGMKSSVAALEVLLADRSFLLISLDTPTYSKVHRNGTLIGLPAPTLPAFVPRRVGTFIQNARVLRRIHRFAPTHVLIRTSGSLAVDLLKYAARSTAEVMAVFANVFDPKKSLPSSTRILIKLLNQPFVLSVANHRQPAVDSMIECGLMPTKAIAYDFEVGHSSHSYQPKLLNRDGACKIVFAGNLIQSKGCADVIAAASEIVCRGIPCQLTIFGDGHYRRKLERIARKVPGVDVVFKGRQPNEEVFRSMVDSTFVCVPTHSEFPEGMPQSLTEALATRTPVIASRHPIFVRAFPDRHSTYSGC